MDLLLQLMMNGLVNGSHYALLGIGFGLIFATTKLVHFAYGPIYAATAYVCWYSFMQLGLPFWAAFGLCVIAAIVLGLLSYLIVYRPLQSRSDSGLVTLIASLGLYTVIENLLGVIFGTGVKSVQGIDSDVFFLGPVFVTSFQLMQIAALILVGGALALFLRFTRYGQAIMAMTDNAEMAQIVGIDTRFVALLVFAIGSAIAAVPAVLILLKDSAGTHMGFSAVFLAFLSVVVGGIGSLRGAVAGGFLIGFVESAGLWQISTDWQSSIAFIILFLMLMLRPDGLFGVKR
ncbi:MAG: branched-chain amino acid ABC transporter permease [Neomegalonema sp.]|nr:branched-chain amino acid ABC transporter permease [Neomegalonema sp.]